MEIISKSYLSLKMPTLWLSPQGWHTYLNIEALHKALTTLTDEEFALINLLYLSKEPLSQETIGEMLGISQQGVSKRKQSILKKLKKFLNFGCET